MCLSIVVFSEGSVAIVEDELSRILAKEYINTISKTKQGREIVRFIKEDEIRVYLDYYDDGWLAWYEGDGRIFFNLKYLMIFFSIEDYDKNRILNVLRYSKDVRDEFVKYTDFLFVHELIHHLQNRKYKDLRKYRDEFVELEYEAFIITDIYFYQKMKQNRRFFFDVLAGRYYDLYTGYGMGGFLSSFDEFERYLDAIKKRYLDEVRGYVSLTEEEAKRRSKLEEKRILSYASGKIEVYKKTQEEYEGLRRIHSRYLSEINRRVKDLWFGYLNDAITYTVKTASVAGNYGVLWRGCYFLRKIYKKNCLDLCDKSIERKFKKRISTREGLPIEVLVEEIYWYEKFIRESGLSSVVKDEMDGVIKDALGLCDREKNGDCLRMIDEMSEFDLLK